MKSILVVDDDKSARTWLRDFLEHMGYSCKEAENGAIALDMFQAGQFDLVITDNQMPVMSGLEFLETMQIRGFLKKIPTIMLTGELTESIRVRAFNTGVNEIFAKPANNHELSLAVTRLTQSSVMGSGLPT